MQKLALAAAVAVVLAHSAAAADSVTSTVIAIDKKQHALVLADKTIMIVGKDVDLSQVAPGSKVAIAAYVDEDGYLPATAVTPAQ